MRSYLAACAVLFAASAASVGAEVRNPHEKIEARVRALKKPDVPWRKIAWKTCLLDALQESKAKGKPIVAWVFIDRPKDDERC